MIDMLESGKSVDSEIEGFPVVRRHETVSGGAARCLKLLLRAPDGINQYPAGIGDVTLW